VILHDLRYTLIFQSVTLIKSVFIYVCDDHVTLVTRFWDIPYA
jgi:hypothetical protein